MSNSRVSLGGNLAFSAFLGVSSFLSSSCHLSETPQTPVSSKSQEEQYLSKTGQSVSFDQAMREGREYTERCLKPIVRLNEERLPAPSQLVIKDIREYCLRQLSHSYGFNSITAIAIERRIYEAIKEKIGEVDLPKYLLAACENPPAELPFTKDVCNPNQKLTGTILPKR